MISGFSNYPNQSYDKLWKLSEEELFIKTKTLPFDIIVLTKTGKYKLVEVEIIKKGIQGQWIGYRGAEYKSIFDEHKHQIELAKKLTL